MIRPSASRLVLALAALAGLMLPALINGTAFLFPDSIGYFHAGEASLKALSRLLLDPESAGTLAERGLLNREAQDGISTSRSVYYGIPLVLLFRLGGEWALMLAQSLIVIVALAAGLRRLAVPAAMQPLALAGVFLAGLGLFTTVILPDVFAGLAVLALAQLLPHGAAMTRREHRLWLLLLLACVLSHKAILAMAAALLGLYLLWHALTDRRWPQLPGVLLVLVVAMAGHMAVNIAAERLSGQKPVQTPFALARIVGDGTAERYLRARCPEAGYRLCAYTNRFPMTENVFLWSHDADKGIMQAVPLSDRQQISSEANALVIAAVSAYPLHQMVASFSNLMAQFSTVGVTEYALGPNPGRYVSPRLSGLIERYEASLAGRGLWPFNALSQIMTIVYFASLALLLALLVRRGRSRWRDDPQLAIIGWVLLGLIVNAAVSGVIGGVFDRYQGRVAWLVPLMAVAALAQLRHRQTIAAPPLRVAP
jgi:hypothetical protein